MQLAKDIPLCLKVRPDGSLTGATAPKGAKLETKELFTLDGDLLVQVCAIHDGVMYCISEVYPIHLELELKNLTT